MTDLIPKTKNDDVTASIEQRFCEGNDVVFDEVIERYSPDIQRIVYRLLAWNGEVEDVVQDVFVSAFAHRRKFRAGSSLKTWLFSITINICRTRNRRRLLWKTFTKKQTFPSGVSVNNPVHSLLEQEQIERVRQAAGQLPQKYRDVIVLKYLEELPTEQIMAILKINEKAFYTRLSRARNLLQQDLSGYLENENE